MADARRQWRDFPSLPGSHLTWRRQPNRHWVLSDSENNALVTLGLGRWPHRPVRNLQGPRIAPSGADTIGQTYSFRGHGPGQELLDEVGESVMRWPKGQGRKGAPISTVDLGQRTLELGVIGGSLAKAVMSATDQAGATVVSYRYAPSRFSSLLAGFGYRWRIEMVISPGGRSVPGVELFAALTARELVWYFASEGSGA